MIIDETMTCMISLSHFEYGALSVGMLKKIVSNFLLDDDKVII